MASLAQIRRHPIKGIGSETLDVAEISPTGALHGDRAWALLNSQAEDSDAWQPRRNFLQVASGPDLAAIEATSTADTVTLSHPRSDPITLTPETDGPALGAWIAPLWPADRPGPARLVRAPGHGMTDMPDPFVSLGSTASLKALSQRAGIALDPRRFRINLWIDGLTPWQEHEWVGAELTLGDVQFVVDQRIARCRAPEANPETGRRDANVLRLLEEAGQATDFGLYLRAKTAGEVRTGDTLQHP